MRKTTVAVLASAAVLVPTSIWAGSALANATTGPAPAPTSASPHPAATLSPTATATPNAPAPSETTQPSTAAPSTSAPRNTAAAITTSSAPPAGSTTGRKTVALTFDDGPSTHTPQVLDILKRSGVKATFCVVGDNAAHFKATMKRIVAEGHQLCNHSRDHANLPKLSDGEAEDEITDAQAQITEAAGVKPKTLRFPYGAGNDHLRRMAKKRHLRILGWDIDPEDWRKPPAATITARIVAQVRPGDVVLMHDGGGDRSHTIASLSGTITKLKARDYTFVLA